MSFSRSSWAQVTLLLGLSILIVLVLVGIMWVVTIWGEAKWSTAATVVQSVGTLVALLAGGGFAFYRLHLLRTFQPHLTIEHEVSHRPVGDSYFHISLTVRLRNSSRVVIPLRHGSVLLQQIAPFSDEEIREFISGDVAKERDDIQWPTLDRFEREWGEAGFVIEPGETLSETYEFVISREVQAVLANSFYEDPTTRKRDNATIGWDATTVYDILDEHRS